MKSPRVLHILPELAPYTGNSGRARASSFLCRALARLGVDVTVVAPAPPTPERWGFARRLRPLAVPGDSGIRPVTVHEGTLAQGRVQALLIQSSDIAVICRAALCAAAHRDRWPDVVHATQGTELAPLLVKAGWLNQGRIPATVFTLYDATSRGTGGIDRTKATVKAAIAAATTRGVRGLNNRDDGLPVALACSDRIVLSSKTYAKELLAADAKGGQGVSLAQLVTRIREVAPGVDDQRWRMSIDPFVEGRSNQPLAERKAATKLALQRDLGLAPQARRALIGILGPYDHMNADTVAELGALDCQLVFLLDSQRDGDALPMLRKLARHRVAARFADTSTEHRLVAAADMLLLPHAFHAEGPSQLHCWHYGALPIAPSSGAFADRIVELDARTATGSGVLYDPSDSGALVAAVKRALRAFRRRDSFASVRERLATADLSWQTAALQQLDVYAQVL